MDTDQIKQLATDVNNVAETSFRSGREITERPLLAKIAKLEIENVRMKTYLTTVYDGDGNIDFDDLEIALKGKKK